MGRRIAKYQLNAGLIENGRRYIYDGWTVCEERTFDAGATEPNAPNTLERVYVNGRTIDEPLLAMIDGDNDRTLGTSKNVPPTQPGTTADFEYYYLCNRMGSVHALLDADRDDRVLEYARYEVYGCATVLPIVDDGAAPGSTANDGLEDMPTDLTDNNAALLTARTGGDATAGRGSSFSNPYTFTARRLDCSTGLLYYRNRYYEPSAGRFVSRDALGTENRYCYVDNAPSFLADPRGLQGTLPGGAVITPGPGATVARGRPRARHSGAVACDDVAFALNLTSSPFGTAVLQNVWPNINSPWNVSWASRGKWCNSIGQFRSAMRQASGRGRGATGIGGFL